MSKDWHKIHRVETTTSLVIVDAHKRNNGVGSIYLSDETNTGNQSVTQIRILTTDYIIHFTGYTMCYKKVHRSVTHQIVGSNDYVNKRNF